MNVILTGGEPMRFAECPPGLFRFEDEMCFKSEYGDAYCSTGEAFWGGANTPMARADLMVQPYRHERRRDTDDLTEAEGRRILAGMLADIDRLEDELEAVRRERNELRTVLAKQTGLARETETRLAQLREQVRPLVEAARTFLALEGREETP